MKIPDIDECVISASRCDVTEECVNTPGSFTCRPRNVGANCGTGFRFNARLNMCEGNSCSSWRHQIGNDDIVIFTCRVFSSLSDVNECAMGTDSCEAWQTCVNAVGSYQCMRTMACGTGYTLNDGMQDCIGWFSFCHPLLCFYPTIHFVMKNSQTSTNVLWEGTTVKRTKNVSTVQAPFGVWHAPVLLATKWMTTQGCATLSSAREV